MVNADELNLGIIKVNSLAERPNAAVIVGKVINDTEVAVVIALDCSACDIDTVFNGIDRLGCGCCSCRLCCSGGCGSCSRLDRCCALICEHDRAYLSVDLVLCPVNAVDRADSVELEAEVCIISDVINNCCRRECLTLGELDRLNFRFARAENKLICCCVAVECSDARSSYSVTELQRGGCRSVGKCEIKHLACCGITLSRKSCLIRVLSCLTLVAPKLLLDHLCACVVRCGDKQVAVFRRNKTVLHILAVTVRGAACPACCLTPAGSVVSSACIERKNSCTAACCVSRSTG